jgi:hypothetical protein
VIIPISIGPVGLKIRTVDQWIIDSIRIRFKPFIDNNQSDFVLNIKSVASHIDSEEYRSAKIWMEDDRLCVKRGDFFLNLSMSKPESYCEILHGSEAGLDTILKFAFVASALRENGFFLHSAASVFDEKGWLFPGISGTGKTTMVRKLDSHQILTDEMALVIKKNQKWLVFGSPFSSVYNVDAVKIGVPIEAIFHINKSKDLLLKEMRSSVSAFQLLRLIIGWKLELCKDQVMDFVEDFTSECYSFQLSYSLEHNIDKFLEGRFGKNHKK